jgi:2-dehydropantoate 2-reductase
MEARMRFIIYGAGGVGGTIGARLHQAGYSVVLVARGAHLAAIQADGLRLRTPEGDFQIPIPAVGHPRDIAFQAGDAVILTMKTQGTESALRDLELAAGTDIPVVCAQNGVENERLASRRYANVYCMLVALPATFLTPGEVIASASPRSGCLHAGRYPSGTDATIDAVCTALHASHFVSLPDPSAMTLKYRKLLSNLGNGVEVITHQHAWGAAGDLGAFMERVREEASRCYQAAGIVATSAEEYAERVTRFYRAMPVGGEARSASSTLQSVMRGNPVVEVDYLNGEIELLGALHGVLTPYNSLVRRTAATAAAAGAKHPPMPLAELARLAEARAAVESAPECRCGRR